MVHGSKTNSYNRDRIFCVNPNIFPRFAHEDFISLFSTRKNIFRQIPLKNHSQMGRFRLIAENPDVLANFNWAECKTYQPGSVNPYHCCCYSSQKNHETQKLKNVYCCTVILSIHNNRFRMLGMQCQHLPASVRQQSIYNFSFLLLCCDHYADPVYKREKCRCRLRTHETFVPLAASARPAVTFLLLGRDFDSP